MKKYLALVVLIITTSIQAWAQNSTEIAFKAMGIKGGVNGFTILEEGKHPLYYNSTKENGCTDKMPFFDSSYDGKYLILTASNNNVYVAEDETRTYKVYLTNGKISRVTSENSSPEEWNSTYAYTYTQKSMTIKESSSRNVTTYYTIDHSAEIATLEEQISELLMGPGGHERTILPDAEAKVYYRLSGKLDKLMKEHGQKKVKTSKETYTRTVVYKDMEYDEVGNVIAFTEEVNGVDAEQKEFASTVRKQIKYIYDKEYLGEFYWNKLKDSDNLDALEQLYNNTLCSEQYRNKAAERWNAQIMSVLERNYGSDVNVMLKYMGKGITSKSNYNQMSNVVGAIYYEKAVLIRDFNELKEAVDWQIEDGTKVFNAVYRDRILKRSNQLRADSVANLNNRAQTEIENRKYTKALSTIDAILAIEPDNIAAQELKQDCYYIKLMDNIQIGNPNPKEMEAYLETFPEGKYKEKVEDEYANYHLSLLKLNKGKEALESLGGLDLIAHIKNLPVNDEHLEKKLKRLSNKKEKMLRGDEVFDFNLGLNYEYGPGVMGAYGEIGFRFGYHKNWVNLYVGGRFGLATSHKDIATQLSDIPDAEKGGYFRQTRATVPVQLRLNLARGYKAAMFLGLGADVNFNITTKVAGKSYREVVENVFPEDSKNWMNAITYSPRVSLGLSSKVIEFELYGLYDLKDNFNKGYLDQINIAPYLKQDLYDAQLKNKWRVGAALRFAF